MIIKGEPIVEVTTIKKSIKSSLDKAYESITKVASLKFDKGSTASVKKPPVSLNDCIYIYDHSWIVAKCAKTLAGDLLLNNIQLKPIHQKDTEKLKAIQKNLLKYIDEFYFAGIDSFYAPYGVFEVAWDEKISNEFVLSQIPVGTTRLLEIRLKSQDEPVYLIEQKVGVETNYFKIMTENYPDTFTVYNKRDLGECIVLGGDNFYSFFKKPDWLQAKKNILADISIDAQDEKQQSEGNIANGVLNINLDPKMPNARFRQKANNKGEPVIDDDGNPVMEIVPDEEDEISDEITSAEGGTAVIFTRSAKPLKLDFVNIQAKNDNYLDKISAKTEDRVLKLYGIPHIRIGGLNNEKETMSTTRGQTVWEGYTKDLKTAQKPFEKVIKFIVHYLYGIECEVDIEEPIFADRKQIEIDNLIHLWEHALLSIKQTIEALSVYINVIDLNNYDFETNPGFWDMRCYNGKPFNTIELTSTEQKDLDDLNKRISEII